MYLKAIFVISFALINLNIFSQTPCNCSEAFQEIQLITSESYAGYEYNINLYGKRNYKKLCRKIKKKAKRINSTVLCEKEMVKYADFFNDKHFNIITSDFMDHLESSNDPPEFRVLKNGQVSYIRIPSFDLEFKGKIDSLVLTNHEQIVNSSLLIIDVLDNEGGGDDGYSSLVPYFYTNPIKVEGIDLKSSKGNVGELERYLSFTDLFDEEALKSLQDWVDKAKGNEGRFVNLEPEQTYTVDTTYNVPQVAIVITEAKSAAEGLILDAIQSEKVTTFGQNSGGVRDFLNVRHQPLESCEITVGLPMTKSTRVPENAIDGVGIKPDVYLESKDSEILINAIISHYNIK